MRESTFNWKQGFSLQARHVDKARPRVLLIGDSVIAGTDFVRHFHEQLEAVGGQQRFEIVKQVTTEAMGWKFLLFLADELPLDVDLIFIFLHAAETIAPPSEFRHVYAWFSHLHARAPGGQAPHVVIFRTPAGSVYGEFEAQLCELEERTHRELGASLVEVSSPLEDLRGDETHYTDEGLPKLSGLVAQLCTQLGAAREFGSEAGLRSALSPAPKLSLVERRTSRSGPSTDICRLHLDPAFRQMECLVPQESVELEARGREVLCLCFIGPYSGVIEVRTQRGARSITMNDSWCTVSRPYVVSLWSSERSEALHLQLTQTDEVPRVKKYSLSERFDHEPAIDQTKTHFEFELSNYEYAGPTLFPFVRFCVIDY